MAITGVLKMVDFVLPALLDVQLVIQQGNAQAALQITISFQQTVSTVLQIVINALMVQHAHLVQLGFLFQICVFCAQILHMEGQLDVFLVIIITILLLALSVQICTFSAQLEFANFVAHRLQEHYVAEIKILQPNAKMIIVPLLLLATI